MPDKWYRPARLLGCGLLAAVLAGLDPLPAAAEQAPAAVRPLQVIDRAALDATGYSDLPRALAAVAPAFAVTTPFTRNGNDHVRAPTLRGLGPDQLVVLVDGKPLQASAMFNTAADVVGRGSNAFDLRMIPLSAVARVELLTGGASGRYGSGAVAGVVNVVLDSSADGGALTVQAGTWLGNIEGVPDNAGVLLDDQAGTITLQPTGRRVEDDGDGEELVLLGSWGVGIGADGYLRIAADYRDRGPSNRAGFDPRQQFPRTADGGFAARESVVDRLNNRHGLPDLSELNVVAKTAVALTDRLDIYGTVGIGTRDGESSAAFQRPIEDTNVPALFPDGFRPRIKTNIDDRRVTLGFRGDHFGWHWDLSHNQRSDELDWELDNSLNPSLGAASPTSFVVGNNISVPLSFRTNSIGWSLCGCLL